jgi:hypothetical protein
MVALRLRFRDLNNMRLTVITCVLGILAALSWGGFWYIYATLGSDRLAYADAVATAEAESSRGENLVRLRSAVQSTEAERAALEAIVGVTILDAVENIETAARDAGASDVAIGEATLAASTPGKLSTFTVGVSANGSFVALVRAVRLFETISIPATLERFDITEGEKDWHLNARLRVTLSATP